ncbi:MAG: FtsX-like permease family protein [Pseudomonadota bacterium]
MNTAKLAMRGLARNRNRSLVTLLAMAFGFAAISLFAGYTHNVYDGLSRQAIYGELLGHLTIQKRGMDTAGKLDPERYLLTPEEVAAMTALIQAADHVKLVTPRLALSGLASNGRASTIFLAEGITPQAMDRLQEGGLTAYEIEHGFDKLVAKKLDPARQEVVNVSEGLLELLNLENGGDAALLVNTLTGQANALDVSVGGGFNTGNAGTNDKFIFMPLALAQSLLDAEGRADRLTVLLDDVDQTGPLAAKLLHTLQAAGYDVEIKTWVDLSAFYRQVHDMFDMIFGFIFAIVLTVVVMSVANSMGMAVVERTREIGTLRAIGLKRLGVVRLFATESLLLALIGCGVGVLITLGVRWGINAADIAYVPPNSVRPVPLLVDLDLMRMGLTLAMMLAVGTIAALLPARRAARQPIIDALGHV